MASYKPLLMTAFKNQMKKFGDYEYTLHNISINGIKRGCAGFIRNPLNNKIIYINTERINGCGLRGKYMYRTARSTQDYTGGPNQWCDEDRLAYCVARALM